jgi:hypothetical protein
MGYSLIYLRSPDPTLSHPRHWPHGLGPNILANWNLTHSG